LETGDEVSRSSSSEEVMSQGRVRLEPIVGCVFSVVVGGGEMLEISGVDGAWTTVRTCRADQSNWRSNLSYRRDETL
jgi:hypothetical protein